MKIKKFVSLMCLFALLISSDGFAALENTNRKVYRIGVTKTDTVVWVTGDMVGQPEACNSYNAISCPIGEKRCDVVISLALAAKLADNMVEFSFSGQCSGGWADVGRFRMMN